MKILLNTLTLVIFITTLLSCSDTNHKKEGEKKDYRENISETVTTFITKNLEDLQKKEEEKITIDSITIKRIDTLTDKSILTMKLNALRQEIKKNRKLRKLKSKKIALNRELGVYENETLKESAEKEIQQMIEEETEDQIRLGTLMGDLNNPTLDSLTFRYYLVTAKITATEADLTQRTLDTQIILTRNFKIKRFEDIK
ncbi:MAG: hypothetical protein K9I68_00340 [Bacteroidales bacterium]|nr:hypothetical protein [Bacteroidales bacterium]MCF8336427.1 hypothetical protein [Bacteroidales bacterium]